MNMMNKLSLTLALTATMTIANVAYAEHTVMVGGQSMLPSKDIVDNAVNSADHTTLVAAVTCAATWNGNRLNKAIGIRGIIRN